MRSLLYIPVLVLLVACAANESETEKEIEYSTPNEVTLFVLGNVQDAGSPQAGCTKDCCKDLFSTPDPYRRVVSLGLYDPNSDETFLFEATPDFPHQVKHLKELSNSSSELPSTIFLTHGHIGHYTGLMYLGKEAMSSHKVPVYAMPRLSDFLIENGPWDQLIANQNIIVSTLKRDSSVQLTSNVSVTPFLVPHRDEYSETVGYRIQGPNKAALFIPDIDKWSKWDLNIVEEIGKVDYAFIDGTFYDGDELPGRDITQVAHPFIIESESIFKSLPVKERNKIYFIHFNHTNPLLNVHSAQSKNIEQQGFNIARLNDKLTL